MKKTYRVIFQGLVAGEEAFREGMRALGVYRQVVDRLLQSAPVVMKQDMPLKDARRYAEAVQDAGGKVSIQEHGRIRDEQRPSSAGRIPLLEAFTECPECGLKQLREKACERCGRPLETSKNKT